MNKKLQERCEQVEKELFGVFKELRATKLVMTESDRKMTKGFASLTEKNISVNEYKNS